MKKLLAIALAASIIAACATTGAPDADAARVQAVQTACAIDAGMRPTISVLLAVPNLATIQEAAAVTVARAAIDQVCSNPSSVPQAAALQAFTAATGQVAQIVTTLQQRRLAEGK